MVESTSRWEQCKDDRCPRLRLGHARLMYVHMYHILEYPVPGRVYWYMYMICGTLYPQDMDVWALRIAFCAVQGKLSTSACNSTDIWHVRKHIVSDKGACKVEDGG